MWLAISRGRREPTLVKALNIAALRHVINVAKGASQRQVSARVDIRVYADAGVR